MTDDNASERLAAGGPVAGDPRRWLTMAVFMIAIFLGGQDATVLNTALPALTRDLLPTASQLLWMVDGYSLAIAAFLVSCTRAGDRWGRKPVFLTGLVVFAASSASAGLASGPLVIDVSRIVQGVGGALIISSVVSTIRVIFSDGRSRTIAYALWTAALSAGLASGPVIGAILVQGPGWRWVFFLNTAVADLAVVLGIMWVRGTRAPTAGYGGLPSLILSAAGLGCVVFALQHATDFSAAVLASAVTGAACLTWFVRLQLRARVPLLELRMFSSRLFRLAALAIVTSYGAYAGLLFLLSQRLQLVDGDTPLRAGLTIVPFAVAVAAGGLLSPPLTRFLTRPRATMTGLLAQSASLIWLAATTTAIIAPLIGMGLGSGVVATLAADLLMSSAPEARAGEAGAIQETAFAVGSGLGVAVLGTVATLAFRARLAAVPDAASSLSATVANARALPAGPRQQLIHTATAGFDSGYRLALLLAATLLLVTGVAIARARHLTAAGNAGT